MPGVVNLPRGILHSFPGGNPDLRLDQVHSGDELGHGMLDLNARIHLNEVHRAVFIHQELDGPRVGVADFL